jgi:hypothetical protein
MIAECVPALYVAFNIALAASDENAEAETIEELYRKIRGYSFSREVLARCPPYLGVKRVDYDHTLDGAISVHLGPAAERLSEDRYVR